MWFDPSVFQDPGFAKVFSQTPGVERLQYIAVSLIIARGLKLQLTFETSISTESWSKKSFSASGGVSVFGFGFGVSGSYSSYDYSLEVSADGKAVIFKDDPQLSRVLAVRLEELAPVPKERFLVEPKENMASDMESAPPASAVGRFKKGEMTYKDLQLTKFPKPLQ